MFKDENRHYSLRKLSVGLASVLIGISFVNAGNTVKADTVNDQAVVKYQTAKTDIAKSDDVKTSGTDGIKATSLLKQPQVSKSDKENADAQNTQQKIATDLEMETTPGDNTNQSKSGISNQENNTANKQQNTEAPNIVAVKKNNNSASQIQQTPADKTAIALKQKPETNTESANTNSKRAANQNNAIQKIDTTVFNPAKHTAVLPNNVVGAKKDDLSRTSTRQINITYPESYLKTHSDAQKQITQTASFSRSVNYDEVKNTLGAYSNFNSTDNNLSAVNLPKIAGYKLVINNKLNTDYQIAGKTLEAPKDGKGNLETINAVYVADTLPELDTNDAYALNPKNGLHEHKNVNNNGGYDSDYWGKLDIGNWNYTQNGDTVTLNSYKGTDNTKIIIPNAADFGMTNGVVQISSNTMNLLAKTATRIGLSKTNNEKVQASDPIWQDAFAGMKYGASQLTQMDLHNLDTSKITDMGAIFNGGTNLATVGDLSQWDTSNVTDMSAMFEDAFKLTDIGNLDNWKTNKVTDMRFMFAEASNLTNIGDLSKWNTSQVTNMSSMFQNASKLTDIGNLDNWKTNKVTDMSYMFNNTFNLTNIGDLSKWDTSNVTNMCAMFEDAFKLTDIGNLDNWKTNKVTNMYAMFADASKLTDIGNLDNWKTNKVTNMSCMFATASNLTNIGDLSKWNTSQVTDMSHMFADASKLTDIGNLDNWKTNKVTDMSFMFAKASNLTNIGDLSKWDTSNVTSMYAMFQDASKLTDIGNLDNWKTNKVTDMSFMFAKASNLTNIGDLSKWDTSNVTSMHAMFQDASKLTDIGNLDNWKTNKVTDMSYMFNNTFNLTNIGDLSKWDTSNVTNMYAMFQNASNLTNIGNLDNWKTNKVTDMSFMFAKASNLTNIGDLSKWDTSNVTSMYAMFQDASKLTDIGNLDNWKTNKVTDMSFMFAETSNLTNIGDLSKWDTSNVTSMHNMFQDASKLTNIGDLGKWSTDSLTDIFDIYDMFGNNPKLKLALSNGDFSNYLVKKGFGFSYIDSDVYSIDTDNQKLIPMLTNDAKRDNATRTIDIVFPASYKATPKLISKYHLVKNGNGYQITQSAGYQLGYKKALILINPNATINKYHVVADKSVLADKWALDPNAKLTLAHKNADGTVSFDAIALPQIPGYELNINKPDPKTNLFAVSFMALPPAPPVFNTNKIVSNKKSTDKTDDKLNEKQTAKNAKLKATTQNSDTKSQAIKMVNKLQRIALTEKHASTKTKPSADSSAIKETPKIASKQIAADKISTKKKPRLTPAHKVLNTDYHAERRHIMCHNAMTNQPVVKTAIAKRVSAVKHSAAESTPIVKATHNIAVKAQNQHLPKQNKTANAIHAQHKMVSAAQASASPFHTKFYAQKQTRLPQAGQKNDVLSLLGLSMMLFSFAGIYVDKKRQK